MGNFFDSKQGAAELKHAVLKRYVRIYFSKTSSTTGGRGVYLDGFAGPGTYDDQQPGSPRIAVDALKPLADTRNVDLYFVEKNQDTFAELQKLCATSGFERSHPLPGRVEDYVDRILDEAKNFPLLAFLDPFGMGLPLDTLHRILNRPVIGRRRPTEILLNVSLSGIYRNAGKLDSKATNPSTVRAHAKTVERMNRHVGDDWWQSIWRSMATDRTDQIARGYIQRLALPGWTTYTVPVSEDWRTAPKYHLVLLSQSNEGVWFFNNAVSGALDEFHAYCHRHGQLSLEDPELQAPGWSEHIAANVTRILDSEGDFVVVDRLTEVLGAALGYARETHIRGALKLLYPDVIRDQPKGNLMNFEVRATGQTRLV